MASLIPAQPLSGIPNSAEKDVAKALVKTLDKDWLIYHSYPWMNFNKKGALRLGEIDFVLYHPKWGLLVLEVKGGKLRFDSATQTWFQSERPMEEAPLEQARRNMYKLIERIRNNTTLGRLDPQLPCPYGYAAIFPHCRISGNPPPGSHKSVLLDSSSLPELGKHVLKALRDYDGRVVPRPVTPAHHSEIRKGLLSNFRVVPSLASALDNETETLARLTDEQAEALEGLYENNHVLVEGVAGSGKTLLAANRARAYAEEGKDVLLVCFNRTLAEHLRRVVNDSRITIHHFHGLAREVCIKARHGFEVPADAGKDFWFTEVAEMLQYALEEVPKYRFDAIIVDEGQDFHTDWYIVLEDCYKQPGGPLYVFFDGAQNLYGQKPSFAGAFTKYNLKRNCRNTQKIAGACGGVLGEKIPVASFSPEGEPPRFFSYASDTELCNLVKAELDRCLREEKLGPDRVALLSHHKPSRTPLGTGKIGRYATTTDLETWQSGQAIWFSTIKAFKGLEADILFVVGIPEVDSTYFTRNDLYVAASRARLRLMVFSEAKSVVSLLQRDV
jgi:hypothetical protein